MRKILFCLLMAAVLVMVPVLAACNGGGATTTTPTTTQPTTTTPTTTTPTTTTPTTTTPTTTTPMTTTPTTTTPMTTTTQPSAPAVPSDHSGYNVSMCIACHGPSGTKPYPDFHADYADDSCLGCHQSSAATTTQPPTTTTTQPPTTTAGETLSDILGHAAGISSVKYDMIITDPDAQTMSTSIWIKNNKMRSEMTVEGQTIITLLDMDAHTMYLYYPDQNMAMGMTYEPGESAMDEAQAVADYNPTIIGTETLDGKECLVVEYTAGGETVKMWLWKEYGFPIRAEMTTSEGTTVMEYKNIEFVDIDNSMFELPGDVTII